MVKEIDKKLVTSITATSEKFQCDIFIRSDSFYEVVFNGKIDYYTKDLTTAILVAKIIVIYNLHLQRGNNIFADSTLTEEQKWYNLLEMLRKEYDKSYIDKHIAINVLDALNKSYNDAKKNDIVEDKILGTRNFVRAKDNLMVTINAIATAQNQKEAEQNLARYKNLRNPFVKANPEFKLGLL